MATELEIKRLLDVSGYARLRSVLDAQVRPDVQAQRNRYLDDAQGRLHAQGAMLRLREIGARQVLTLKTRARVEAGVLHAQELEREVTDPRERAFWQQATLPWPQVAAWLAGWLEEAGLVPGVAGQVDRAGQTGHNPAPASSDVVEIGATDNERRIYALASGLPGWPRALRLELDHTVYPGGVTRLELECEDADALALAPLLDQWLSGLGVAARPATETKYGQFLRLIGRSRT